MPLARRREPADSDRFEAPNSIAAENRERIGSMSGRRTELRTAPDRNDR
jgi:hypothetical protein